MSSGGEGILKHAKLVQLEVSVRQYNHGSPLAAEVIAFMSERQFIILDLTEVLFLGENLTQFDLLFCSPELKFLVDDIRD